MILERSKRSYILKHAMDKIFAICLLCIFSPLIMLIALSIKLEGLFFPEARGPILVSEPRISEGKIFQFYKFRKAKKEAWDRIKNKKPGTYSASDLQRQPKNLTFMGRVLKKFYLDEFPQVFNVLKGNISFVGPRPHIPKMYYDEIKRGIVYEKIMRCGLTGLLTVNKDINKNRSTLDAEYFGKYSAYHPVKLLFYDMFIMIKTVALVFRAKGF